MAQAHQNQPASVRMDLDEVIETGEAVTLPDGVHAGTIKEAYGEMTQSRQNPKETYRYFQLDVVPEDQPDMTLRYGCPLPDGKPVTDQSKLGRLLLAFGQPVGVGNTYTLKQLVELFQGQRVKFQTINKPNAKGTATFANIVDDSIKPAARSK